MWSSMGGGLNFGSRVVLCSAQVCVTGQCLNNFLLIDQLKQASSSWSLGRGGGGGCSLPKSLHDWGNSVLTNCHQSSVIERRENRSKKTTNKCPRVNSGWDRCDDAPSRSYVSHLQWCFHRPCADNQQCPVSCGEGTHLWENCVIFQLED